MAQETQKKIGALLLEKGYITESQLKSAMDIQARTGTKLGSILVEAGIITEDRLVEVVSQRLNIPKLNLNSLVINPQVISSIPVDVARRYLILPVFKMGNNLTVAMVDPLNAIALDEIRYLTKCVVKRAVVGEKEIKEAIDRYYSVADSVRDIIGKDVEEISQPDKGKLPDELAGADSTVVRLVNLILTRAVQDGASDVHFEPDETQLRIRYRVNGVMREEAAPPKKLQAEIISRLKIASELDVSEKRLPQDGRMSLPVGSNVVDLRVSTLPTIHGEKVVIRILDRRSLRAGLGELGMREPLSGAWKNHIRRPEGLILISGPTSSGKTSTLYASLQEINSIEKNIITVEDPVEFSLRIINQVQINEKAGLTFASALRSILRQNPDIIMIGEIRDSETAAIAVRAALTGHLVFSTIHTNDSVAAVTRLIDMGIERFMVASALEAVLAQRLVRTICTDCKEPTTVSPAVRERIIPLLDTENMQFFHGAGCMRCRGTGFAGQTGIYELVGINDHIREMILNHQSEGAIAAEAYLHGYRPLFEAGCRLISEGVTTIDEVLRVTSPVETGEFQPPKAAVGELV
jgi:type IV pilus assembly protein PilB